MRFLQTQRKGWQWGRRSGFALITTVSLMVLVALLALGLLGLSTVSLRASSHERAMVEARSNARLALTLAIGQLQKAAGPDQRITAPGDLRDPNSSRALTGVWESRYSDPTAYRDPDENKRRVRSSDLADGEFVGWLSSDQASGSEDVEPPSVATGSGRVRLLRSRQADDDAGAGVVGVGERGGLAWMTMDEGVKARFELPRMEPTTEQHELGRLRAPERPATEIVQALGGFVPDASDAAGLASFSQGHHVAANREEFDERLLDLSPWSVGLETNVVHGGLKQDLTLAFERDELPAELQGRRIYSDRSSGEIVESEPYFALLADHYRLYEEVDQGSGLSSRVPADYQPVTLDRRTRTSAPSLEVAEGSVLSPVVTRVNVSFSLVAREAHGHWRSTIPSRSGDSSRIYMVYMIYTPVATVYNPYTVPIEVESLEVSFQHLPLAFQFYRNGRPQTTRPALLSQFHISSENREDWEDRFTATLTPSHSSRGSSGRIVTLQPGEARVFGVNHPPGTIWANMTNYLYQNDLNRSQTLDMTTAQGWNYNSGFIVDWLAPMGAGRAPDNRNLGVFGVGGRDTIDVACTPKAPRNRRRLLDHFTVEVSARVDRRTRPIGIYRYRYGSVGRLIDAMEAGSHPAVGEVSYPFRREKPWRLNEIFQTNIENLPIERWTAPKQFALFTLAARTSQDSLYPTKPGRDSSFVNRVLDMDITGSHPAQMPMELSFLPVTGQGANAVGSLEVYSADDPRSFFFSGWTAQTGLLHYPVYQVPRSPVLNIADLRHANLASSGHLPTPPYTVGESFASPLLAPDQVIDPASQRADHAWLANNTLWDNYWFSGIGDGDELRELLAGEGSPANPRLQPWSGGRTDEQIVGDLTGADGWKLSASHLTRKGTFNVNSTSVEAWECVLSSLLKREVPLHVPEPGRRGGVTMKADKVATEGTPLPRLLDGPAGRIGDGATATNQERWAGFRELSGEDVRELAEEIVNGVRERGPFLSMSEFVNRRPDGEPGEAALEGMIQQAIRRAGLNDDAGSADSRIVGSDEASEFQYPNPRAAEGDTEEAAASFLSQGDVLSAIGAALSVRSDTFRIRAYGESRDSGDRLVASAVCEAIVQRVPGYLDPDDPPEAAPAGDRDATGIESAVNERFGRRLRVIAFRWIPSDLL